MVNPKDETQRIRNEVNRVRQSLQGLLTVVTPLDYGKVNAVSQQINSQLLDIENQCRAIDTTTDQWIAIIREAKQRLNNIVF